MDDDAARAREQGMAVLKALYRHAVPRDLEAVAAFGPPRACVDGVREVVEAGAEMILLTPLFDEAAQMERLAADVIPRMLE